MRGDVTKPAESVVPVKVLIASPLEAELIGHCRSRLIKWSCPREIEFRDELPKTRVGKIDFTTLAREAAERRPVS